MKPRKAEFEESPESLWQVCRLLVLLLLLLWGASLVRPAGAYPFEGAVWTSILAVLAFICAWLEGQLNLCLHERLRIVGPAALFTGWVFLRWGLSGFPSVGVENCITLLTWIAWLYVGLQLSSFASEVLSKKGTPPEQTRRAITLALCYSLGVAGALSSVHGLFQYFVLYDIRLRELLESIGQRTPTALEMGLIHHFKLKRVASVWGDPNAFGCFSALALCGWMYVWQKARDYSTARIIRFVAGGGFLICIAGILVSGSRGAVLDAAIGLTVLGVRGLFPFRGRFFVAAAFVLCVTCLQTPTSAQKEGTTDTQPLAVSSWWRRSDTIRERVHYATVGWKLIQRSPIIGMAPGSVEVYFGELKPPEARESKYLHNWLFQITAELGLVGLGLYIAFLVLLFRSLLRGGRWRDSDVRVFLAMLSLFVFDSSIELSFNQRELMMTFGVLCGLAISVSTMHPSFAAASRHSAHATFLIGIAIGATLSLIAVPRYLALGCKELAEDLVSQGETEKALRYVEHALKWQPRDPSLWTLRGYISQEKGALDEAETFTQRALTLNPRSASIHDRLAQLREIRGDIKNAESLVRRALELYPSHPDYWHHLALLLEKQGRLPEALAAARNALRYSYLSHERDAELVRRLETVVQHTPLGAKREVR